MAFELRNGHAQGESPAGPSQAIVDVDQLSEEVDKLERTAYQEVQPGSTELPSFYKVIKTLMWIKDNRTPPVYREALEEWEKRSKVFASSIERKTKQIESLKNEIYNLVGFYSVFQGVVFTAVAQGNEKWLTCYKVAIPITLSLLASLVSFIGIWEKLKKIQFHEGRINSDLSYKQTLERFEKKLLDDAKNFRFAKLKAVGTQPKETAWGTYFGAVALLVVSLFLPSSFYWMLCLH
ncbi:uncharacterized protein [Physcomitrium patens]|uniref:Uncharacterized protein n=1 Tax=Physcomitrium patens TaxID=3218 RepID=A9TR62_PHYPA|nr:uncharacterized protein LOC112276178 [Physcomitrium patens]PNR29352.1 hypothetical protein PHYPA_028045 [Physcomitrium patens]|eukprot:XP_024363036.1 uncharacterized protein LOC112276178 [Physcomitrella patens]